MPHADFTPQHRAVGKAAAWAVFGLGVLYAITTVLGFRSLRSPDDPFGEPFFTIMEVLILCMAPLMIVSMNAVHAYATAETKIYSRMALSFMILVGGITSGVHFLVLTVSHQLAATGAEWVLFVFSFKWPSVVYALDILAWDWFFALSMFCAAPVFKGSRLERVVRNLMLSSGVLSLVGLLGIPLADMQVRNIGILGYAVVAPVLFLLMGFVFERT